ncbi:CATRA system-associated protein [Streptomyces tauricus]
MVRSLRRVPEWRLTPAQWEAVGAAIRDIAGLWYGEDRRGLRAAAG